MSDKIKVVLDEDFLAIPDVVTGEVGETEEEKEIEEKIEELEEVLEEVKEDPKKKRKLTLNLDTVAVPEVEVLLKHLK